MKNIDQDFELIQQYLENELAADQRASVEKRLADDQDFAQLYRRTQTAVQVIQEDAEQSTLKMLQGLHQQEIEDKPVTSPTKVRRLRPVRWIGIAATLALLVVAAIWLFRPSDPALTAFNEYYQTPSFDLQRGANTSALLSEISIAYNAADYATALGKINDYEAAGSTSVSLQIFKAVCYLELDNTPAAINELSLLTEQDQQLDEIYWLRAMAYLKDKNKEAARSDLQQLLSEEFSVTLARRLKVQNILESLE